MLNKDLKCANCGGDASRGHVLTVHGAVNAPNFIIFCDFDCIERWIQSCRAQMLAEIATGG